MQCHPFPLLSLSHLPPSPLPSHFPPLTYYLIVLLIHFSHSIYPARYGSGVGDPGSGEGKRHGLPTRRRCTSLLTHSILSSPLFSYRLFSLQSFPLLTHGNSSLPSSSSLLPSVSPPVSTFVLFSPPVYFSTPSCCRSRVFTTDQFCRLFLECYEKAWKLEFEASAAAGFKLAFCYLKCRKFVEAIDVCETVLELYPDYPRIREEILKKAILGVRSQNI